MALLYDPMFKFGKHFPIRQRKGLAKKNAIIAACCIAAERLGLEPEIELFDPLICAANSAERSDFFAAINFIYSQGVLEHLKIMIAGVLGTTVPVSAPVLRVKYWSGSRQKKGLAHRRI
ncbi:hypothetical protein [Erythrobacter ani]|uniref:Uncharacterized protein n=1 Tax=Erythrobacter ani TaxID=2827235 RepID=A0ABS6SR71_9SPHN|nr:hypothetical protein [Erythrobacter ani]MBV7267541.1 hypothetical protein [Erythrobacter ani]